MILDLRNKNKTLSYIINGKDYGKAFDIDDTQKYRMAVSICEGRYLQLCHVSVM